MIVRDQISVETGDGQVVAQWTSAAVQASIARGARSFSLSLATPFGGGAPPVLKAGAPVRVLVDGSVVLTGYVFKASVSVDGKRINWQVSGRSKTADLIDSSAGKHHFSIARVPTIAKKIAAPFGVEVVTLAKSSGDPFERFRTHKSETAFEAISRAAKLRGLWLTDDALGRLVLTEAGHLRAPTPLVLGGNVISMDYHLDTSKLHSTYEAGGQSLATDQNFGEVASDVTGHVFGFGDRHRPLYFRARGGGGKAAKRAQAKRAMREASARAMSFTYKVPGWRQENGGLWAPNMLVRVVDPVLRFDGELLIEQVRWNVGREGPVTELKLAPLAAFERDAKTSRIIGLCGRDPDPAYQTAGRPFDWDYYPLGHGLGCEYHHSRWLKVRRKVAKTREIWQDFTPDINEVCDNNPQSR